MRHPILTAVPLALTLATLAACTPGGDTEALSKEVASLRAQIQRVEKDNERLSGQVASAERKIGGLHEDLARVRELAVTVQPAPVPSDAGSAAVAEAGTEGTSAAISGQPSAPALEAFLSTVEGRKVLASAIETANEERDQQRQKRMVDSMVDRFAKTAGLSEDQSRQMKEIMGRAGEQTRAIWSEMRERPQDMTPEDRDARRQQNLTKTEEIRQKADNEVKAVLSTAQYEQYQQEQDRMRATMRGFGAIGGGQGGGGGGGGRRNQNPGTRGNDQ